MKFTIDGKARGIAVRLECTASTSMAIGCRSRAESGSSTRERTGIQDARALQLALATRSAGFFPSRRNGFERRLGPTAVSLFTGMGGLDLGIRSAGYNIVLATDIDPVACQTYRLNHATEIVQADLRDLRVKVHVPTELDLLFGGPPCQGFSRAGKMDVHDARSEMVHTFFDAVENLKPRAYVCENVPALAQMSKWSAVRELLIARSDQHYHTALLVLNASDFGVTQNRQRMFLVGVRRDIYDRDSLQFAAELQHELEDQVATPSTVGEIVRKLGPAGSVSNPRTCGAKVNFLRSPILRRTAYAGMIFIGAGRPLSSSGISSTLTASMGGNKTPIVDEQEIFGGAESYVEAYHRQLVLGARPRSGTAPKRLRRLTVDECLAVQGFPADYLLAGSRSAQYRQIGNAVPPPLAAAVAKSVKAITERATAGGARVLQAAE